jgi:hypothetical protein
MSKVKAYAIIDPQRSVWLIATSRKSAEWEIKDFYRSRDLKPGYLTIIELIEIK